MYCEKWRSDRKRWNAVADAREKNGVWRREKDGVGAVVWEKREKVGAVVWEKREKREKGDSVWRMEAMHLKKT